MALYMNGQEISQSSGVPIAVEGLTEIDSTTPTSLNGILKGNGSTVQAATAGADYMAPAAQTAALPTSGTALTANTLYTPSTTVGTYSFTAPATGWAHGIFITGTTPNITFTGKIIGKLPDFAAGKQYEFDVYRGAWIVQEVVTQ